MKRLSKMILSFTCMLSFTVADAADSVVDMREGIRQASGSIVQVIHEHVGKVAPNQSPRGIYKNGVDPAIAWLRHGEASMRHGESIGSGFVVGNDQTVLTVLSQAPSEKMIVIDREGVQHPATVQVFDEVTGCALLRMEDLHLPPLSLAEQPVEPGLPIATLWARNPQTIVVGQGIVATLPYVNPTLSIVSFETDVVIGSGASGGAAVDASGQCVGLIFANFGNNGQGVATVLPITVLQPVINLLDAADPVTLKSGMLGIRLSDNDASIQGISDGSPAEKAGFQTGDKVIRIAGQPVQTSMDVQRFVRTFRANDTLKIDFQRGDEQMELEVTLQPIDRNSTPLGDFLSELPGSGVLSWWMDGRQTAPIAKPYENSATAPPIAPVDPQFKFHPYRPQGPAAELLQPPRYQVERSDLEESIRALRDDIDKLREQLKKK